MNSMNAVFVDAPGKVRIAQTDIPTVSSNEVLIKVLGAGICGSDVGIYYGTNALAQYPVLVGHEYGGQVVQTGDQVTKLKVGDLVAVDPVRSCGGCYACKSGRHNVCPTLKVTGVHCDGGFREYISVAEEYCYRVDIPGFDSRMLCLVEPYSIGVQVSHRGRINATDRVLVMGSGPIGLCVMQAVKKQGAVVTITDLVKSRMDRAAAMGADHVLDASDPDYALKAMALTENGLGYTVVVDTVCTPASFEQAVLMACPAGRVVTLGLTNKASQIAQVEITKKELDIVGSRLNRYRFPEVIDGFASSAFTPEKLCSHFVPYQDVERMLRIIKEHPEEVCKVILTFDQG